MERIAFILLMFCTFPISASDIDLRLNRELNFIIGTDQNDSPPPTPKVFSYEDWKGSKDKKSQMDEDGMIVDSTSTALAAPVRNSKQVIIKLNDDEDSDNQNSIFKAPRKRFR